MGTYTFRSAGTVDYDTNSSATLTPGAPAGRQAGDLLLLFTAQREAGQTITSLAPDWTQLYSVTTGNSLQIWARIADGGGADTPTIDWTDDGTGSDDIAAWIEAYSGDVHTDLTSIVAHSNDNGGGELSNLVLPTLAITTDNTLVVAFAMRRKSITSNDATTITAGGGLTKRQQHIQSGNAAMMLASASAQQGGATSYDGTDFTRDGTDENQTSTGVVLALKSAAGGGGGGQRRMMLLGVG